MTDRAPQLPDAAIERALAQRAPHGADATLRGEIVANAGRTRQRRSWWPPFGRWRMGPRLTLAWVAIAVAGSLTVGVVLAGGLGQDRSDLSVVPPASTSTSGPTQPSVGPTPTPRPTPTQNEQPETIDAPGLCATSAIDVRTGDAMGQPAAEPSFAGAEGVSGVFTTSGASNDPTNPVTVWATTGRGATIPVAMVGGPDIDHVDVADLSADGRVALVMVASTPTQTDTGRWPFGYGPVTCVDLYLAHTDGSGATYVGQYDTLDGSPKVTLAPDGQHVGYERQIGNDAQAVRTHFVVGEIEVATGQSIQQLVECSGYGPDGSLLWSPRGDRLAAGCNDSYQVLKVDRLSSVVSIKAPEQAFFDAAGWADDDHMILAGSGGTLVPINLLRADAVSGALEVVGQLRPPDSLKDGYAVDGYSRDLRRWLVDANERNQKMAPPVLVPGPAFVIDASGTVPTSIPPAIRGELAWSTDGSSIVYVDRTGPPTLTRLDLDPTRVTARALLPDNYVQGIWRIP